MEPNHNPLLTKPDDQLGARNSIEANTPVPVPANPLTPNPQVAMPPQPIESSKRVLPKGALWAAIGILILMTTLAIIALTRNNTSVVPKGTTTVIPSK